MSYAVKVEVVVKVLGGGCGKEEVKFLETWGFLLEINSRYSVLLSIIYLRYLVLLGRQGSERNGICCPTQPVICRPHQ